jgi:hypothetical protein
MLITWDYVGKGDSLYSSVVRGMAVGQMDMGFKYLIGGERICPLGLHTGGQQPTDKGFQNVYIWQHFLGVLV